MGRCHVKSRALPAPRGAPGLGDCLELPLYSPQRLLRPQGVRERRSLPQGLSRGQGRAINPPGVATMHRCYVFLLRTEVKGRRPRKARGGRDRGIRFFSWLHPAPSGLGVQGCTREVLRFLPQTSKIQLLPALLPGPRSDSPAPVAERLSSDALESKPTGKV